MATIRATVRGGKVETDGPIDLPDGTEVEVTFPGDAGDGPLPPEEIARVLAAMEQIERPIWTDEEYAAWQADRQARKEWHKAHFFEHAEKLRRIWE